MIAHSTDPPRRTGPNAVVRLFSSIRFGVILLTLILIYASVASALPQVRGALEMSEMEIFRHWSFVLLTALFCTTMIVATWRRIRWNLTNLGVLTVHTGLILLVGGSVWYFGNKIEGDTMLFSPKVELVTLGAASRPVGQVLAEPNATWSTFAPGIGGNIRLTVVDTQTDGLHAVNGARVRVEIGNETPREVELSGRQVPVTPISDRLGLRLASFEPETRFFDNEHAALYYRPRGAPEAEQRFAPIPGLPTHRERFLPGGPPIADTTGAGVASKRTWPHLSVLGLQIPTGWLEHWRLPIRLNAPELPFDVQVTGYLPYVSHLQPTAMAVDDETAPAGLNLDIGVEQRTLQQTLFATPRDSLLATGVPLEFVWCESDAARTEYLRSLEGPHELTVEIQDPPLQRRYTVSEGQTIVIEGTDYQLAVKSYSASWPLMSPGFEGASSPMLSVDVTRGETTFNRSVIQRFPQFNQDIDAAGKRHREPVDANIVLRYRGAPGGWLAVVAGPRECRRCPPQFAFFDHMGRIQQWEFTDGATLRVDVFGTPVTFANRGAYARARAANTPVVTPLSIRRPNLGRQPSVIRLQLTGRDAYAGWSQTEWAAFSAYPHRDPRPLVVRGPDGKDYELLYSRVAHDLGGQLALKKLSVNFFPGRTSVESWRSDFVAQTRGDERPRDGAVYTNQTFSFGPWTLFQSGAPSRDPHWEWTILGVGNRYGIWPMILGCIFIPVGCLYAFYVKPVLVRRRKQQALATAGARTAPAAAARVATGTPDLAEVSR